MITPAASILETERLTLVELNTDDAPFVLRIVNEPSWLQYIGDRGVRNMNDARQYILDGPVKSYKEHGFGLYLAKLKNGTPIGLCGLLKREALEDVDVGFAFLPEYTGHGYAYESASAVMEYGRTALGLGRIVAITAMDNHKSIKLLQKLGLSFEKVIKLDKDEEECKLFGCVF